MLNRRRWLAAAGGLAAGVLCLPGQALAGLFHRRGCVPVTPPCCPDYPLACPPLPERVVYTVPITWPPDWSGVTRPFTVRGTYSGFSDGTPYVACVINYPGTTTGPAGGGKVPASGNSWSYTFTSPPATTGSNWAELYSYLYDSATATTALASYGPVHIQIK